MTEKLYYWAENLDGYSSDNDHDSSYEKRNTEKKEETINE